MYSLEIACKEKPVGIKSIYVGGVKDPFGRKDDLIMDRFIVTLMYLNREMTTDYYMGIGNRVLPKYISSEYAGLAKGGQRLPCWIGRKSLAMEQLEKMAKPQKPKIEEVLYSLLLDSSALDLTFDDWCDEFGYDSDSIKAKKTFDECNEQGKNLKKLLGKDYEYFMENNEY